MRETPEPFARLPEQLVLGLYELPAAEGERRPASYPKVFTVDCVRGYGLVD